jgi:hypothetical protein
VKDYLEHSLVELEKEEITAVPEDSSYLIKSIFKLKQKRLRDFEVEDLRLLIGQNVSLNFLLPLAIDVLEKNPMAEGDFYAGDLLHSVVIVDASFWKVNNLLHRRVKDLLSKNSNIVNELEINKRFDETVKLFMDLDS